MSRYALPAIALLTIGLVATFAALFALAAGF